MPSKILNKDGLEWAFTKAKHVSTKGQLFVVFLDGNSIKAINDTHGHVIGDFVIYQIAKVIDDNIRQDDRAVRFGGDEFVLFLPNFDKEHARAFIFRLQQKIRNNEALIEKVGTVTISAGVIAYDPEKHKHIDDVVAAADKLMYVAKKAPPYYLQCENDPLPKVLQPKAERKTDLQANRKRSLFNWVVAQVATEISNPDMSIVILSAREIWKINGNKVLFRASANELVQLVKSAYNTNKDKYKKDLKKLYLVKEKPEKGSA